MSMSGSVISAIFAAAALLLSPALPILAQQTTAQDVGQKMAETGEAMKDYTIDKEDEAVSYAKKLRSDIDAKIKELEARASKQSGETKAKSERTIKDLKAKVSAKLNDLSKASKASWDETKKGFADAYRDLAMAYHKSVAEFEK